VIVNYNGSRWLRPCLDALRGQRGAPTFDVLVVDNGSTDESLSLVGREYPEVSVVASAKNVGFAEGNNLGARAASGDWLVFLNNDTVAEPDWLAKLAAASCSRPEFQIFTSRIVFLQPRAIRQVDVLVHHEEARIEPTERMEQFAANHHGRAARAKHLLGGRAALRWLAVSALECAACPVISVAGAVDA
jgi:GT2 family glycosyltransferase